MNSLTDLHLARFLRLVWLTFMMIAGTVFSSAAIEYEVTGRISQTIIQRDGSKDESTSEFAVFVRDCGWLIQTIEDDGKGNVARREIGSTNGVEIFDLVTNLKSAPPPPQSTRDGKVRTTRSGPDGKKIPQFNTAVVTSNGIPVGFLDKSIVGHVWLMFASQCYWTELKTDQITPVYDWRASAGADPGLKKRAEWELLNGPGSLPREVRYLGRWDETNGLYRVTGTNAAGETLIPAGFVFEERFAVAMTGMVLRKRVDAQVTSVRPACSRSNLLPEPEGRTMNVDLRLVDASATHLPTYEQPPQKGWPSVEQARKLAAARNTSTARTSSPVMIIVAGGLLLAPLLLYLPWKKWKQSKLKSAPLRTKNP